VVFCSDLVVVSDSGLFPPLLLWLPFSSYRGGMTWSEFRAFPMDGDKSLKGHLASFQGSLIPPFKEMEVCSWQRKVTYVAFRRINHCFLRDLW
jgi:hypothetical protein